MICQLLLTSIVANFLSEPWEGKGKDTLHLKHIKGQRTVIIKTI